MDSLTLLAARGAGFDQARWCPHKPHPKQAQFLALDCLEALYGGAAGGGKSDALLMDAMANVGTPGYAAMLFRRTYADLALPGAIMSRSHDWLQGTDAHWNGDRKTWIFPSQATLSFGYLDTEMDKYRYQSAELQYLGFDELTQFPKSWYIYLLSRLRRLKGSTIPLKGRGATNPGGIGHKWVKERFVDEKTAVGMFVASTLDDNPSLDREEYELALSRLDPITHAQLRHGVWVQDSSGLVYSSFHRRLVVPMPPKLRPWRHILAWDFGNVDDAAWGVLGWEKYSRVVYLLESEKKPGMIPSECAEKTAELRQRYAFDRIVGDVGGLGKGYAEEMRRRYRIPIEPAEKVNKLGYIKLMNGAMHNREFLVCEGNEAYCIEAEELAWADEDKLKEAPGLPNHLTDMALYGWRTAVAWTEIDAPELGPQPGTAEWELARAAAAKQKALDEAMKRARREGRALRRRYG